MIVIYPMGGLANRMRAIDSALQIARKCNKKLKVIWLNTRQLNCNCDELFQLPSDIVLEQKGMPKYEAVEKLNRLWIQIIRPVSFITQFGGKIHIYRDQVLKLKNSNYDFLNLGKYHSVYIYSQDRFYSSGDDFKEFVPCKTILDKVNKITGSFNEYTIGIHIRRTDNTRSISESPTELFVSRMAKALEINPETNFFVSTDSVEEEKKLRKEFGSKIISTTKKLERYNPDAIKDALVDLLCLSRTSGIFGSFWSSFSEVASAIGGNELEILRLDR